MRPTNGCAGQWRSSTSTGAFKGRSTAAEAAKAVSSRSRRSRTSVRWDASRRRDKQEPSEGGTPDHWLPGRQQCEQSGAPMEGISGAIRTGQPKRSSHCLKQRKKMGEVSESDTSPTGGDGGNRTPVRRPAPRSSPGTVCWLFLGPRRPADLLPDGLSQLSVEADPLTRSTTSGSLNDARIRAGSTTRADGLKAQAAIRQRERSRCGCVRHLLVCTHRLRAERASSTRFPSIDDRRRNRSSPIEFFNPPPSESRGWTTHGTRTAVPGQWWRWGGIEPPSGDRPRRAPPPPGWARPRRNGRRGASTSRQ